jgi:hypothetical protein
MVTSLGWNAESSRQAPGTCVSAKPPASTARKKSVPAKAFIHADPRFALPVEFIAVENAGPDFEDAGNAPPHPRWRPSHQRAIDFFKHYLVSASSTRTEREACKLRGDKSQTEVLGQLPDRVAQKVPISLFVGRMTTSTQSTCIASFPSSQRPSRIPGFSMK